MTPEENAAELARRWKDGSLLGLAVRRGASRRLVRVLLKDNPTHGGVVLDREIDGFRYWNIAELTLIPEGDAGAATAEETEAIRNPPPMKLRGGRR